MVFALAMVATGSLNSKAKTLNRSLPAHILPFKGEAYVERNLHNYEKKKKNYPATNPINQPSFNIEPTTKKH